MSGTSPTSKPVQSDATSQEASAYKAAIDASVNAQARLGWAFAPHAQDTPNMTVRLEAGAILSGVTLTEVAAQSTGTITAPSANPRIDRVVIDRATGAVSVVTGSEGASPSAPAIPTGKLPVARVALTVGMTVITDADLTDERVGGSGGVRIGSIASPSEEEAASTQDVADALAAIPTADATARGIAIMDASLLWRYIARASAPLPGGYLWTMQTDELATKTNATHDGANKRYGSNTSSASDILPAFTGDTTSGYSIAASSSYGGGYEAYRAVDDVVGGTNRWLANASTGSLTITLPSAQTVGSYTIVGVVNSETTRAPKTWTLQGSNNGTDWTTLDTRTNYTSFVNNTASTFSVAAPGSYLYYRLNVTAINGGDLVQVGELELLGVAAAYNMTLKPTAVTVGSAPDSADIYLVHQAVDSVTLNTDIKVRASRDNGSNWSAYVTLAQVCAYDASFNILKGTADLSALASDTSVLWEITTYNGKNQRIAAVGMLLD